MEQGYNQVTLGNNWGISISFKEEFLNNQECSILKFVIYWGEWGKLSVLRDLCQKDKFSIFWNAHWFHTKDSEQGKLMRGLCLGGCAREDDPKDLGLQHGIGNGRREEVVQRPVQGKWQHFLFSRSKNRGFLYLLMIGYLFLVFSLFGMLW